MDNFYAQGNRYYNKGKYNEAAVVFSQGLEQDDVKCRCKCAFGLAWLYNFGLGVYKDEQKAKSLHEYGRLLSIFADDRGSKGDSDAQYLLGRYCEFIKGNVEKALYWYKKAAEQNNPDAMFNLACYYDGLNSFETGELQENREVSDGVFLAFKLYKRAAEKGNINAQNNLGYCYFLGKGIEQDYKEAIKWWTKAARAGNGNARLNLGHCYSGGHGVNTDNLKAFSLYKKAAEQGHSYALVALGECYSLGRGVNPDSQKALEAYRQAAEDGNCDGKLALAKCYMQGSCGDVNTDLALKLYYEIIDDEQASDEVKGEASYQIACYYRELAEKEEPDSFYNAQVLYYKSYEYYQKAANNDYKCDFEIKAVEYAIYRDKAENSEIATLSRQIRDAKLPLEGLFGEVENVLKREFGKTWDLVQQQTKECLITSYISCIAMFSMGSDDYKDMDFSAAIVPMMKACEIEFGRIFFNKYLEYLKDSNVQPEEFKATMPKFVKANVDKSSPMQLVNQNNEYVYFKQKRGVGNNLVLYIDEHEKGAYTLGGFRYYAGIDKKAFNCSSSNPNIKYRSQSITIVNKYMQAFAEEVFKDTAMGYRRKKNITRYLDSFATNTYKLAKELRNPASHSEVMPYWKAIACSDMVVTVKKILKGFLDKIKPEYLN